MKTKAARLHGPLDLRVEEIDLPDLGPYNVLVKVKAVGICQSDVECYEGKSSEGRYDIAPYVPGHEWSGVVEEVGSEVTTVKKGDKVTGDCVMECGVCRNCKDGLMPSACLNMREAGFRPDSPGAMGEYLVHEERFLHKIPNDLSFEEGAWIENFSVAYFGIWGNGGHVDASENVIISGTGPIGLSAVIVAKTSGARVIVIEPLSNRRKIAQNFGADEAVDPTEGDLQEKIMELTNGRGGDLVVECSGNDNAIAALFDISGHNARVRLIGHSIGRKIPVEIGKTIWKTLNITGAGGTKNFMEKTIRFMSQIRDKYDFEQLISYKYPFEKIHEAFEKAQKEKQSAIKIVLEMG